jgi:hypothetical protein
MYNTFLHNFPLVFEGNDSKVFVAKIFPMYLVLDYIEKQDVVEN